MQNTTPTTPATAPAASNRPRSTFGISLFDVLRVHGLNEFDRQETKTLQQFQALLAEKTAIHERIMLANTAREVVANLREDLRLFRLMDDRIATVLTGRFNQKASI